MLIDKLNSRIVTNVFLVGAMLFLTACEDGIRATTEVVANTAPQITSEPVTAAETGVLYAYQLQTDVNDAEFSLVQGPAGMSVDAQTGVFSWMPRFDQEGTHDVTAAVSAEGVTTTQGFTIEVDRGNAGDVNDDGQIDVADLILAKRFVLALDQPTATQQIRADVYVDGVITASDLMLLERRILEVTSS